jgi:putative methionine-R-sulfoxide reductase with GAF domain
LNEAMAKVASESGISFDPRVVEILERRYVELERLATEQPLQAPPKLSTDIKVERGLAPAAGFAEAEKPVVASSEAGKDFVATLTAARREAHALSEFGHKLGAALSLDDTLSLLAVRVKQLVPHDSMAVYVLRNKILVPEFVSGENFRLFSSLRIPIGEGLSGWVAQNVKAILNGNPSVEPGYLNDPTKYSTLRSALAVPLEGTSSAVAVLALYRARQDGFSLDDLKVLQAIGSQAGVLIEEVLKHPRQDCGIEGSAKGARAGR